MEILTRCELIRWADFPLWPTYYSLCCSQVLCSDVVVKRLFGLIIFVMPYPGDVPSSSSSPLKTVKRQSSQAPIDACS